MRLLKEPLLHFAVIGGLIFAVHGAVDKGSKAGPATQTVRITTTDADWLREMWARQWQRPPTDEELTRLLTDHLTEEVLAREARALELDVGDTIVRRRLAQKMAFLLDDTIRLAEPTEAELRALYETRPDLVRTQPRVSFTQVYFRRGSDDQVRATLAALSDDAAVPDEMGDSLVLGDTFADQDEQALTNLFGASFAKAVLALPVDRWSGPIQSSYGLHIVKVTALSPVEARPFEVVRGRLEEEWRRERQERARSDRLGALFGKYQVSVDPAVRRWVRVPGEDPGGRP
ncbi:peptidylprolyl isomerase [Prosthecomicrobium sp. N25]|uniref:peptidylprolyl isomerase n=1 Tax=Prosthecomicrobium sp. N25 TaxID=3129254 RepID=UPI003076F69F